MGQGGRLVALVAVVGLALAGCSSDDGGDGGADGSTPPGGGDRTSITIEPTGAPRDGGKLAYGIEADTSGFDPYLDRFSPVGLLMGNAVYDPLAAFDDQFRAQPYLAERIEPDETATVWTITLRPDVTFHDGSPLDAQAVATHLERAKESFLTQSAIRPIDTIEVVDEVTVRVTMSSPWVAFPVALTGQGGMVPSPAVEPGGHTAEPVGTGPFVISERSETSTLMVRYDGYWQPGLPHLASVEFVPDSSVESRVAKLQDGTFDIIHSTNEVLNADLRAAAEAGELQYVRDTGEQEELFVMFNTAAPPFDDLRVREAAAYAIDLERYLEASAGSLTEPADGVFSPGSVWYEDVPFPRNDPERARALVEEYAAENGPVTAELSCSQAEDSLVLCQAVADMWGEVGIATDIRGQDQTDLINFTIAGQYQSVLWRQFGSPDPDGDYHWWIGPIEGETSLNFSRNADPDLDAALEAGRQGATDEERRAAYVTVQERFAANVPYVWLERIGWVIAADNAVREFQNQPLPDGTPSAPYVNGIHRLTGTWLDR